MAVLPAAERIAAAWQALATVPDPEVPAISLCELGVVREVSESQGSLEVVLTPTYSGCPATELIRQTVRDALLDAGLGPVQLRERLAPAWTTDWISEDGRRKLREYGIAPPGPASEAAQPIHLHARGVPCPRCGNPRTERLSAFGSTACKALYRCLACREPFEHFKAI